MEAPASVISVRFRQSGENGRVVEKNLSAGGFSMGRPSPHADRFTLALAEVLQAVRRQSVTFAPEAGTERMRRLIRKETTGEPDHILILRIPTSSPEFWILRASKFLQTRRMSSFP